MFPKLICLEVDYEIEAPRFVLERLKLLNYNASQGLRFFELLDLISSLINFKTLALNMSKYFVIGGRLSCDDMTRECLKFAHVLFKILMRSLDHGNMSTMDYATV